MTKLSNFLRAARWILPAAALVIAGLAVPSRPAEARVFVGIGIGGPVWGVPYYPYYYPPYAYSYYPYAYPPGYYYPPAAQPAPTAPAQGGVSTSNCRDYSSTETIDGRPQTVTGTACQQPDGSWRIVR